MIKGLWPLRGSNPVLYTDNAADVIVDLQTGKEYIRGVRVLFCDEKEVPKTIEETEPDRWKFYYPKDLGRGRGLTANDVARELIAKNLLGGK